MTTARNTRNIGRPAKRHALTGGNSSSAAAGPPKDTFARLWAAVQSSPLVVQAAWIPILIGAALGFFFVWKFGVNEPWAEEWLGVQLLVHQAAGSLTWADYWAQYNEHHMPVTWLIAVFTGALTKFNTLCWMYGSVLQLCALAGMVIFAFLRQFPSRASLWLIAPAALLLFSWRQNETFLMGLQVAWMLSMVLAIATFLLLHFGNCQRRLWPFALAAGTATVATFTVFMGMFAWPVGLGQILLLPLTWRRKIVLMAVWAALCAVELLLYFHGYVRADLLPPPGFSHDALQTFFPVLVGLSLVGDVAAAKVLGFVILLLAAFGVGLVVASRQWSRYSFWLAVMAFSLLSLAVITFARSKHGLEFALPSRYTTISILLVISVYVLLASQALDRSSGPLHLISILFAGLMVFCLYTSDVASYQTGQGLRDFRTYQAFVLSTIEDQPDEEIQIGVGPRQLARTGAIFLRNRAYSVFAPGGSAEKYAPLPPALPTLHDTTPYKIEGLGKVAGTANFFITGWAVDGAHAAVAGGVYLVLDGKDYPLFYGLPRPDIAASLPGRNIVNCGFNRVLPARCLTPGHHQISLKILTNDRQALFATPEHFDVDIHDSPDVNNVNNTNRTKGP